VYSLNNKLVTIVKKNFKILIRSKSSALIIIFGPLLLILLVGSAFNTSNLYDIKVGSYSLNYNDLSNSIIEKLQDDRYQVIKTNSQEECINGVKQGAYHLCTIFPENLEIAPENNIEIYVDQSRINLVYAIKSAITSKVSARSEELSSDLTSIIINQLETSVTSLEERRSALSTLRTSTGDIGSKINTLAASSKELMESINVSADELIQIEEQNIKIQNLSSGSYKKIKELIELLKVEFYLINSSATTISQQTNNLYNDISTYTDNIRDVETTTSKIIDDVNAIKVKDVESIVSPIKTVTKPITSEKTHINYLFPTLIMIVVMFVSLLLSSITVIREKLSPAYFRNFISPTNSFLFIFATYLTNILIIIFQLAIVFAVMLFIQPALSPILLNLSIAVLAITSVFILLGMIVGYVFNSEETATVGAISLGTILLFFSNTIIPLETLSVGIKKVVDYNIFVVSDSILRKIILFQEPLKTSLREFYILLAHAVIFIAVIVIIYKVSTEMYNIRKHLKGK